MPSMHSSGWSRSGRASARSKKRAVSRPWTSCGSRTTSPATSHASSGCARAPAPIPGETLESVEEWGAHVRSVLFVARGTLEQERERIVVEANALGSAVLGEQLGGSSATLVRQRIEATLA